MSEEETTSQAEVKEVHNEVVKMDEIIPPPEGQPPPSDGVGKTEGPETTKEPEAPKTYSEDEWKKRESDFQSDRDTKVSDLNKAHKEELGLRDKTARKALEAASDEKLDKWVKSVENDGGDVDAAKRVAEREKSINRRQGELDEMKRKQDETDASQQSTLKYLDAQKLAKEHDIPVETLMQAKDPAEMKDIAQVAKTKKLETRIAELEGKGTKEDVRPVTTTDKGVATGTGQPVPETAQGKMRSGWAEIHTNK